MNACLPHSALRANRPPTIEKETTVFMSGNSQAVRIPKEFQLQTKQVRIMSWRRIGYQAEVPYGCRNTGKFAASVARGSQ